MILYTWLYSLLSRLKVHSVSEHCQLSTTIQLFCVAEDIGFVDQCSQRPAATPLSRGSPPGIAMFEEIPS